MSSFPKIIYRKLPLLCLSIVLISCSGSNSGTNVPTVPSPTPPASQDINVPTPTPNPNLPDLTNAAPINLVDKTNYSDLNAITAPDGDAVYPPLVGDPLIKMSYNGGRSTSVSGSVLISFEDSVGFWGAELPSFSGTGFRNSNSLDMIFADSELVIHVVGTISNDTLSGNIYYRVRAPGDTACEEVTVSCGGASSCNTSYDTVTPCEQYATISNMKNLGSFSTSYSSWESSN